MKPNNDLKSLLSSQYEKQIITSDYLYNFYSCYALKIV